MNARLLDKLIDRKIVRVRTLTTDELIGLGWAQSPTVLVLDDGTEVIPGANSEGTQPGVFWVEPRYGTEGGIL